MRGQEAEQSPMARYRPTIRVKSAGEEELALLAGAVSPETYPSVRDEIASNPEGRK